MYQALYRKYRPRTFDEVVGQPHITDTLRAQVASGRLSHAYLFIGTRGTGKTTCAKLLAKAVNCLEPENGNPCNRCAACRGIDDGSVLDVVEIDAASNNGVENVRALREEAVFSPASVRRRVYIIDEVHMLSTAAFNALLKILEEPPAHLMFILATTELRKVPATILSRCQRYSFRRLDSELIAGRLDHVAAQEGLKLTPEAAALLARLADGGMRDALSLLDQCAGAAVIDEQAVLAAMGLAGNRQVARLLEAVAERDAGAALDLFSALWREGKDPAGLLSDLCGLLRDVLLLSLAPRGGRELLTGGYGLDTLRGFAARFTHEELLRGMTRIQEALASLRDNPSPRTAAELCLVSLCDPRLSDGLPELLARVSRLEAREPLPAAPRAAQAGQETEKTPPAAPSGTPVTPSADPPGTPEAPSMDPPGTPEIPPEAAPAFLRDEPAPIPEPEPVFHEPPAEARPPEGPDNAPGAEQPAPPAPAGGAGWEALAARMKARLPLGVGMLLDDPLQVVGELADGRLTLRIAAGFAEMMLHKPEHLAAFREEAERLTGAPVRVEAASMDSGDRLASRSLEELEQFKQIKFI